MLSLLDIAPPEIAGKDVEIRGVKLTLRGVAAIDWARLYARFPELRTLVSGGDTDMTKLRLLAAQCAVIAAGVGHLGNADIERAALTNLSAEEQNELVADIIRLSNPGDVYSPLLDAVEGEDRAPDTAGLATK